MYLIAGIIFAIAAAYYFGFLNSLINWGKERKQKAMMIKHMIDAVVAVNSKPEGKVSFTVNDTDTSVSIFYDRLGTRHPIFLPYNRGYVASMAEFKAELLREHHAPIDITQQPGLPYVVSGKSLGGHTIRITNCSSGKMFEYKGDTIPGYAAEVFDNE